MSDVDPTPAEAPQPGWYVDTATGQQRWWDGAAWVVRAPVATAGTGTLVRTAKDSGVSYLLAILLGGVAAHHFYLGHPWAAVAFVVLLWGGLATMSLGIGFIFVFVAASWWVLDLFLIPSYVRTENEKLQRG
jgi:TM2 domain-containing membrane protein YozV